jgi:hypothetical protein
MAPCQNLRRLPRRRDHGENHLGIDPLAGQDLSLADTSRWSVADALRSTRTRHDADANLGLTESRPASCDDHVAGERQLTATAQGIAFDRRITGLRHALMVRKTRLVSRAACSPESCATSRRCQCRRRRTYRYRSTITHTSESASAAANASQQPRGFQAERVLALGAIKCG